MVKATLEECRRQAQKCVDESTLAQNPSLKAHWLALAEQWVTAAEWLRQEDKERGAL